MKVLIDVGNTNICIGIFSDNKLCKTYRLITQTNKTSDEYYVSIKGMIDIEHTSLVLISSVVPGITTLLIEMFKKYYHIEVIVLEAGVKTGIQVKTVNPKEVGSDIICDAVGSKIYGSEVLVIDLGTAIKYIYIKNGVLLGVVISPGIVISMKALIKSTALLPNIDIKVPPTVLGTNTFSSMQSGVTYGVASQVEGMIERIKKEVNSPNLKVVATGGLSNLIIPICNSNITLDLDLTLKGLNMISEKNNDFKAQ